MSREGSLHAALLPSCSQQIRIAALLLLAIASGGCRTVPSARNSTVSDHDISIKRAFNNGTSNVQVEGEGVVTRVLSDDVKGSRHQRFILRLASGRRFLLLTTSIWRHESMDYARGTASRSTASMFGTQKAGWSIGRTRIRKGATWQGGSNTMGGLTSK